MSTRGKQFGLRYNCEKNGCVEKNGQECPGNGRIVTPEMLGIPTWGDDWDRAEVHGHLCDKMSQVVIYESWQLEESE